MKPDDLESRQRFLAALVAHRRAEALAPSGPLLDFARYYFPLREGMDMIVGPHHHVMGRTLDKVLAAKSLMLIATIKESEALPL